MTSGERVKAWVLKCFGEKSMSRQERALRLVEEAIELAQAEGIRSPIISAITYRVFSRPPGDPDQEAGGVGVCLEGWGAAAEKNVALLTEQELQRIESKPADHFRQRHNAKVAEGLSVAPIAMLENP